MRKIVLFLMAVVLASAACSALPELKTGSNTGAMTLPGKTEPDPGTSVSRSVKLPDEDVNPALTSVSGRVINKDILKNASNLQLRLLSKNKELAVTRTNAQGEFKFIGEFPVGKLRVQAASAKKSWDLELKGNEAKEVQLPL
jgi:hypothetical protein